MISAANGMGSLMTKLRRTANRASWELCGTTTRQVAAYTTLQLTNVRADWI